MSAIDVVILIVVIAILAAIVYFGIVRKGKSPCSGCAYAKNCEKAQKASKGRKKDVDRDAETTENTKE